MQRTASLKCQREGQSLPASVNGSLAISQSRLTRRGGKRGGEEQHRGGDGAKLGRKNGCWGGCGKGWILGAGRIGLGCKSTHSTILSITSPADAAMPTEGTLPPVGRTVPEISTG